MPAIVSGLTAIIISAGVAPAIAGPLAAGLVYGGSSPSFSVIQRSKK